MPESAFATEGATRLSSGDDRRITSRYFAYFASASAVTSRRRIFSPLAAASAQRRAPSAVKAPSSLRRCGEPERRRNSFTVSFFLLVITSAIGGGSPIIKNMRPEI